MTASSANQLHLLCRIGSTAVALIADQIEAVVKVDKIVPVPGAPGCVRGLAAIRSRLLTLIDSASVVGEVSPQPSYMAILTVGGHGYGLLLDGIDEVAEIAGLATLPVVAESGWTVVEPTLGDHAGELVLVVDPQRFIAAASQSFAQAA